MDKSWIDLRNRTSKEYIDGVERFLEFDFIGKDNEDEIYCPCSSCGNRYCHKLSIVRIHIERKGFDKNYKVWSFHGENVFADLHNTTYNMGNEPLTDDISNVANDMDTGPDMVVMVEEGRGNHATEGGAINDELIEDGKSYYKRLEEAEKPFYEGCPKGITELSVTVEMLRLKQLNGWSNHSITMWTTFLKKIFPHARFPKSYYHANKLTSDLGFKFETWDACPNGCMLFRNEAKDKENCEICEASRYKDVSGDGEQGKKVAIKQVRYFPLKPRLQRLFWSSHTAPLMKWHAESRINDGVMRHPANSRAWKAFDEKHPSFLVKVAILGLG